MLALIGDIKILLLLLVMRVQGIHWNLATCVAAGEGHDPHFEHLSCLLFHKILKLPEILREYS